MVFGKGRPLEHSGLLIRKMNNASLICSTRGNTVISQALAQKTFKQTHDLDPLE